MNHLILRKRSIAIIGIGIVAVSIGLISKKLINYPAGSCVSESQKLTFNI